MTPKPSHGDPAAVTTTSGGKVPVPKERMTCNRCGRNVAANRITRGPDGRRLRAPIRVPVDHRVQLRNGRLGEWCGPGVHQGRPR